LLARVAFALSCSQPLWQPGDIVSGHREGKLRTDTLGAAQHGPGEGADGLAPAKTSSIRLRMRWLTA
jgi:hypothetical protein